MGASALLRFRRMPMGVSRCSIRLRRRFLPGVNMAVRRSCSARRAALACGVGALLLAFLLAEAPRRTELRRSRETERSRGVWTERRDDGGSPLMALPAGVRDGVLPEALGFVGVVLMMFGCTRRHAAASRQLSSNRRLNMGYSWPRHTI